MGRWLLLFITLMLSAVPGYCSSTNEVMLDVKETAMDIEFTQCEIDGQSDQQNLSKLTVDFCTREVKLKYNLTELSQAASSPWFNPDNGLIGFINNPSNDSTDTNIYQALLSQGNYNIMALDASSLMQYPYLHSNTMIRCIGQSLAYMLFSMTKAGLEPSSIHLIGHTLGSHIAGSTGKTFNSLTGSKVGRISGLDPAGLYFSDTDPSLKLNKYDANFVDVIHTDPGAFGSNDDMAHINFYTSTGRIHPEGTYKAWQNFGESVNNREGFPAVSCSSLQAFEIDECDNNTIVYMGLATKPGSTGQYYLRTADSAPYALGMDGVKQNNNDS